MKGLNYIERDITAHLQRVMKLFPVVTVCGPRQAGKTTLIRHLYPEYEYVNLENTQTRQDFYNDPQYFVRFHKAPCIFDEIQNTPELPSMLQEIIDEKDTPGMYILTGSRQSPRVWQEEQLSLICCPCPSTSCNRQGSGWSEMSKC